MAWIFCSKQDVVAIHPVPISDLKDEWSEMVEALIKQHMGMPYLGESVAVANEWHDGDNTPFLHVKKPPIISVTSIQLNDATLTADEYVAFTTHIELKSGVFTKGQLNIKVSYQSGLTTIDPVIRLTAAAIIVAIVNYRKRWGSDSSVKWSEPQTEVGQESPNYNVGLTSHLIRIMKQMLRRPIRVR